MRSQRLVSYRPGQMTLEEHDLPVAPPPGGILARAAATAISPGTEVAGYLGHAAFRTAASTEPYYPGYCFAGEVLAVGGRVEAFQPGDRVCGPLPHASHVIEDRAERLSRLTVIPERVSDPWAAMTQLGCIALNAVRLARLQLGESVAVVGAGLVGLLAGRLAQLNGARPVVSADLVAQRRAFAAAFGADLACDPSDVPEPADFDVVFEATGSPTGVLQALKLVARGGRVILLGSTRGLVDGFDPYTDVHRKGVSVIGAHVSTAPAAATVADKWTEAANRRYLLSLMRDKVLDVSPLLTHFILPGQAAGIFAELATSPAGYLGVIIDWSQAGPARAEESS